MGNVTNKSVCVSNCIECLRIGGVAVGFYFAYDALSADDGIKAIRLLTLTIGLLCGTSAFEGLFLAKASACAKGYDSDSSITNPYQKQNTLWFVASTVMSFIVFICYPDSATANVTYLLFINIFLGLSAINHSFEAVCHGNLTWQNLNRPFLFIVLIVATIPIIRDVLI